MARTLEQAIDALVEAAEACGRERTLTYEHGWARSEDDARAHLADIRAEVDALVAASRAGQGEGR
jgi:hypothetical protein